MTTARKPFDKLHIKELIFAVGFFLLFILLSKAAETLQYTMFRSSPWNPATALAVIAGVRFRWWSLPVVFGSYLSVNVFFWSPFGFGMIALLSLAQVVAFSGVPALILHQWPNLSILSVRMIALSILIGIGLSLLGAIARIMILENAYDLPFGSTFKFALMQSVGNAVSILTITPIYFAIKENRRFWSSWDAFDLLNLGAIIAAVYVVFGLETTDEFKFFYLLFLPVIMFSLRRGFAGAALSILLTDLAMILLLVKRSFDPSIISELQVLMMTLSFAGLCLGATISEREQGALRFQESQAALLRSSRLSLASEMASALSHELNQPLASIRAYIRSVIRRLEKNGASLPDIDNDLAAAVREVDGMAALIKSMRQFLNKDTGSFEAINIQEWVRDTLKLVAPDFRRSGIEITTSISSDIGTAHGNYVQLQQVLANLLRNAKEARNETQVTTRIEISASDQTRHGFIEVSVLDNGPGVDGHKRTQLFKPLQSDKTDGLGLGLSLCSTIIRGHGGEIWLDSAADLKGSLFAFTVPISTLDSRVTRQ